MTKTAIKEKIIGLQAELELLKKSLEQKVDFDVDEINWQKIKPEAKKQRGTLYKKFYGKGQRVS